MLVVMMPDDLPGMCDWALVLLGYAWAFRHSGLVALDGADLPRKQGRERYVPRVVSDGAMCGVPQLDWDLLRRGVRDECPAKSPATAATAARRRRMRATSPGSSRFLVSLPRRSNVRQTGRTTPIVSSQRSRAATWGNSIRG